MVIRASPHPVATPPTGPDPPRIRRLLLQPSRPNKLDMTAEGPLPASTPARCFALSLLVGRDVVASHLADQAETHDAAVVVFPAATAMTPVSTVPREAPRPM